MPQLSGPVTIQEVTHFDGTSKKTGKPFTIYKVKASDGNTYETFDAPTAQQARDINGGTVLLEYEIRQQGEYTNYDLKGVRSDVARGEQGNPLNLPSVNAPSTAAQDKDKKISRQNAQRNAALVVGPLYGGSGATVKDIIEDLRQLTEEFVLHAEAGNWATSAKPEAPAQAQAAPASELPWPAETV